MRAARRSKVFDRKARSIENLRASYAAWAANNPDPDNPKKESKYLKSPPPSHHGGPRVNVSSPKTKGGRGLRQQSPQQKPSPIRTVVENGRVLQPNRLTRIAAELATRAALKEKTPFLEREAVSLVTAIARPRRTGEYVKNNHPPPPQELTGNGAVNNAELSSRGADMDLLSPQGDGVRLKY